MDEPRGPASQDDSHKNVILFHPLNRHKARDVKEKEEEEAFARVFRGAFFCAENAVRFAYNSDHGCPSDSYAILIRKIVNDCYEAGLLSSKDKLNLEHFAQSGLSPKTQKLR